MSAKRVKKQAGTQGSSTPPCGVMVIRCRRCAAPLTRPLARLTDLSLLCGEGGEPHLPRGWFTVTVVAVTGNKVRLAFDAPDQVRILRGELACWLGDPAACGEPVDPACPSGERQLPDPLGEEIVRLGTASGPEEAHRWRQALEDQGIGCRVVGESLGGFGVVYPGHPVPELWVHRDQAARAQALLEGLQEARPR